MNIDAEDNENPIIYGIENLMLKECFIEKPIFRLKHFTRLILVNQDLTEKLMQSDINRHKTYLSGKMGWSEW